jgi:hypothetical protein
LPVSLPRNLRCFIGFLDRYDPTQSLWAVSSTPPSSWLESPDAGQRFYPLTSQLCIEKTEQVWINDIDHDIRVHLLNWR